jgi:hypothetical protein
MSIEIRTRVPNDDGVMLTRYPLHAMYCDFGPRLNLCDFSGQIITMPIEIWAKETA